MIEQAIGLTESNLPRLARLAGSGAVRLDEMGRLLDAARARLVRLQAQRARLLAREAADPRFRAAVRAS